MKRFMIILAVAVTSFGAPVTAQDNQSTLIFYNNTSVALSLVVDNEHGHRCRVFVQYGSCSTYVTAGSHAVAAKLDNGEVGVASSFSVKVGETFTWTVYEE